MLRRTIIIGACLLIHGCVTASESAVHWGVVSYQIAQVSTWADEDAEKIKSSSFVWDNQTLLLRGPIAGHDRNCRFKTTPSEDPDNLMSDFQHSCGSIETNKALLYEVASMTCSDSLRLPPYMIVASDGGAVLFGDGIHFCFAPLLPKDGHQ